MNGWGVSMFSGLGSFGVTKVLRVIEIVGAMSPFGVVQSLVVGLVWFGGFRVTIVDSLGDRL